MNTQAMSLNELFHFQDNDITRKWFDTTNFTPEDAIIKAENFDKETLELLDQLNELEKERDSMFERLQRVTEALDALRSHVFEPEPWRESIDFSEFFAFYEEGSVTVTEFNQMYCPDMKATAMHVLDYEGSVMEVWATDANDYFSSKAKYIRVY